MFVVFLSCPGLCGTSSVLRCRVAEVVEHVCEHPCGHICIQWYSETVRCAIFSSTVLCRIMLLLFRNAVNVHFIRLLALGKCRC